jgi:predicted MPP superfamily phosphohydrolase
MIKTRNISPRSFTKRKTFPGTTGNPFDLILHSAVNFDRIPITVFAVILILLSILSDLPRLLSSSQNKLVSPVLLGFYLLDWLLISFLPRSRRSFGPVKPVVLVLALLRFPFMFLPFLWAIGFQIFGTLLVIYGFFIEPFRLDVHSEIYSTTKLPPDFHLRMVHLGDLHIERNTRREDHILKTLEELKPDLILFSGDILNLSYLDDPDAQNDARAFLNRLYAPMGIYGVSGSPAVDMPDLFPRLVEGTPLIWLRNGSTGISKFGSQINIYGLDCSHIPEKDEANLQNILQESSSNESVVNILLHHSPDFAPNASRYGFDLMLSGHTHGGQVCLPFYGALFAGSLYGKTFESGRYLVNGMALYVTRGLGMEGAVAPRVRFLCPPEVIVWDICGEETK